MSKEIYIGHREIYIVRGLFPSLKISLLGWESHRAAYYHQYWSLCRLIISFGEERKATLTFLQMMSLFWGHKNIVANFMITQLW